MVRDIRNFSDYDLAPRREFATDAAAHRAIRVTADALALLDTIGADGARTTAIAAQIRVVFP